MIPYPKECSLFSDKLSLFKTTAKRFLLVAIVAIPLLLTSCAQKSFPVSFLCNDPTADVYVDGNFIGNGGPIQYVVPAGAEFVTVECILDGKPVFSRKYNVRGQKNVLFDINIPRDYQYHTN